MDLSSAPSWFINNTIQIVNQDSFPAYNGFILTTETAIITPTNPFFLNAALNGNIRLFRHETKRWTNVSGNTNRYREITKATNMGLDDYKYTVKLYRIWNPVNGQGTAGERFVFYTDTSRSPKGYFLRIEDLKARLEGSVADIAKIYEEDWNKEDNNRICIPVWPINGGKAGREHFSWIKRAGRDFVKQFTIHLNIAQRAEVSIVEGWSPHLRYWDGKVKARFLILVAKEIFNLMNVKLLAEDIYDYNIYFKPVCDIQCEDAVSATALGDFTFLSEHVLGFYKTYVFNEDLSHVSGAIIGRFFPSSEKINKIQNEHFAFDILPATSATSTKITRLKILGARPAFRTPQQVAVMNGLRTAIIASEFWGNGNDSGKFLKATEWLHRSAFGFGGLEGDNVLPQSSQTKSNLIFGTYEANTFMLRLESSIKNLTILEEKRNGTSDSSVYTQPQFPTTWKTRPQLFWCAPQLRYTWAFMCTPLNRKFNVTWTINLFSGRPPTRFEAYLDELIEERLYQSVAEPVAIEDSPGLIDQLQIDEVNYTGDVLPESPHQSPEDITP